MHPHQHVHMSLAETCLKFAGILEAARKSLQQFPLRTNMDAIAFEQKLFILIIIQILQKVMYSIKVALLATA